jgi:hypothetical protein
MMADPPEVRELAERVIDLDRQVKEKTRTLWFTRIPKHEWSSIRAEYPASEETRQQLRDQLDEARKLQADLALDTSVDWDEFAPAAVAACCVEPPLTLDDARWMRDFLPEAEWNRVWQTCFQVNAIGTQIPKYVSGIVETLNSELNSTTPDDTESHSASSEDG